MGYPGANLPQHLADFQPPPYEAYNLPRAGLVGRLINRLDSLRGLWMDNGYEWTPVKGVVDVRDFNNIRALAGYDNAAGLKQAINQAIAANSTEDNYAVTLGVGTYEIYSTAFLSDHTASPISGFVLQGQGRRASRLKLITGGVESWFYNNLTSAKMTRATFDRICFQTDSLVYGNGFKITGYGGSESFWLFNECWFDTMKTSLYFPGHVAPNGAEHGDTSLYVRCRWQNIEKEVIKLGQANSVMHVFIDPDISAGIHGHCIRVESNDGFNNGGGGEVKMFGGNIIIGTNGDRVNLLKNGVSVTADSGTKTIGLAGHGLAAGTAVTLAGTSEPGGVSFKEVYFVLNPTADDFQLATDQHTSTPVNITSAGSGVTLSTRGAYILAFEGSSGSGGGNCKFEFFGIRPEFHGNGVGIVHAMNLNGTLEADFYGVNLDTVTVDSDSDVLPAVVLAEQNKRVMFHGGRMPAKTSDKTSRFNFYTISRPSEGSTPLSGQPGVMEFDQTELPYDMEDHVFLGSTWGQCHISDTCFVNGANFTVGDYSKQRALANDFGARGTASGGSGGRRLHRVNPIVYRFPNGAADAPGGSGGADVLFQIPLHAILDSIDFRKKAGGSGSGNCQFKVGNSDKSVTYGASVAAARTVEHTITVRDMNVHVDGAALTKVVRLWMETAGSYPTNVDFSADDQYTITYWG